MSRYRLCGLCLAADLPLPDVPSAPEAVADCEFRTLPAVPLRPRPGPWLHHWTSADGEVWLSAARERGGYLLRFQDMAEFSVTADGALIDGRPAPGLPLETLRHLLLDQVIPLVLSHRGRLALHASAVAGPRGAIAFVGRTGRGKSTLGASFCRSRFELVTDDCLVVEEDARGLAAVPGYPAVRLWPDVISALFGDGAGSHAVAHYTDKRALAPDGQHGRFPREPVPLREIFVLDEPREASAPEGLHISPLPAREAFAALLEHTYRLDISDRERLRREFDRLARLAARCRVSRLTFPRDLAALDDVRAAVERHLSEGG